MRRISCGARAFDVPVYEHLGPAPRGAPAALCLAGGGSSGVVFAQLIECAAARGVRVVAFDFPGHTPEGLLGPRAPAASLLRHATPRVRARIVAALLESLIEESPRVSLIAHSAGVLDAAAVADSLRRAVARFALLGTGVPGFAAMWRPRSATTCSRATRAPSTSRWWRSCSPGARSFRGGGWARAWISSRAPAIWSRRRR